MLGNRSEITYQDIHDMKYCSSVFKEALRIWPAAPNIGRRITENMNIGGCEVPANTKVMVMKRESNLIQFYST